MVYSISHDQIHQIQHPCGLFNKPCSNTPWLSDVCGLHLCIVSISDELNWFQQFLLSLSDYFSSVKLQYHLKTFMKEKHNWYLLETLPEKSQPGWTMENELCSSCEGWKVKMQWEGNPSSPSGLLCEQRFYTCSSQFIILLLMGC